MENISVKRIIEATCVLISVTKEIPDEGIPALKDWLDSRIFEGPGKDYNRFYFSDFDDNNREDYSDVTYEVRYN